MQFCPRKFVIDTHLYAIFVYIEKNVIILMLIYNFNVIIYFNVNIYIL